MKQRLRSKYWWPRDTQADVFVKKSVNGPQFKIDEFLRFGDENNIQVINTAPYWAQQNEEVERQRKSLLKSIIICKEEM